MDDRNFTFMFYGFAAVWVVLAAYIISLAAREGRIKRQLENIRKMIDNREESQK